MDSHEFLEKYEEYLCEDFYVSQENAIEASKEYLQYLLEEIPKRRPSSSKKDLLEKLAQVDFSLPDRVYYTGQVFEIRQKRLERFVLFLPQKKLSDDIKIVYSSSQSTSVLSSKLKQLKANQMDALRAKNTEAEIQYMKEALNLLETNTL